MKANSLKDGIIMYCAESREGQGDFASIAIKNRFLEFRFDTGSGKKWKMNFRTFSLNFPQFQGQQSSNQKPKWRWENGIILKLAGEWKKAT